MSSKTSARRLLQEAEERAARADCAACAARVAANKAHLVPLMDPKLWASMYEHAHTAAVEAEATARVAWSAISGELEDEAIEEEFTEFAFATYETYRLHGRSQEEAMQRVIEVAERGDRDESLAAIRAAWAVSPPQLPEQRGTGIAALAAAFRAREEAAYPQTPEQRAAFAAASADAAAAAAAVAAADAAAAPDSIAGDSSI